MTEIVFKGKEFVYNHHLTVPFRPLQMQADKGIGSPCLDGNLIIQGDNLHALKSLLPMYAGKVDCIFIDPPYNTGNEGWCYNDNVNAPMIQEWFNDNPIDKDDGLRHDKWCAMMWPRLRLLHELLADNGSIWITLDDNEVHRAKLILDEIFGEENFVANIIWQHSVQGKGYNDKFSVHHNHLLAYGKADFAFEGFERSDEDNRNYSNPDNDPKGDWRSGDTRNSLFRKNLQYAIPTPSGGSIQPPENGWRWKWETFKVKLKTGEAFFAENETKIVRKIYLSEQVNRAPETIWFSIDAGTSRRGTSTLKNIFNGTSPFPTPKPIELVERMLALLLNKDALILDSFAGSGTTAHAVLEANKKDGGNRKFILVEMEDYANDLTAERVRRVINGYDYKGTQKTELMREKLSFSSLKQADKLLQSVAGIENLHGHEYDHIKKTVKNGELVVTGERICEERAEGLGGEFTYCTLGDPVDLDKVLTGEQLPEFAALGSVLFHMATSQALDTGQVDATRFYLGEHADRMVWMLYKPDLDWLKSPDAALTLTFARQLSVDHPGKQHLVMAPARYVSQKLLHEENLPVEYAPLPFALYRVEAE